MTARQHADAIKASVATLGADRDFDAFDARQRALWAAVEARGRRFKTAVCSWLR